MQLDEDYTGDYRSLFTKIFLPQGYPDSVSKDYLNYQVWDTAQAFCSTVTGMDNSFLLFVLLVSSVPIFQIKMFDYDY